MHELSQKNKKIGELKQLSTTFKTVSGSHPLWRRRTFVDVTLVTFFSTKRRPARFLSGQSSDKWDSLFSEFISSTSGDKSDNGDDDDDDNDVDETKP